MKFCSQSTVDSGVPQSLFPCKLTRGKTWAKKH